MRYSAFLFCLSVLCFALGVGLIQGHVDLITSHASLLMAGVGGICMSAAVRRLPC